MFYLNRKTILIFIIATFLFCFTFSISSNAQDSNLHIAFHPTCKEGKKIAFEIGENLKEELEGVVKDFKMRNKIECEFKQDGTPKDFPFWIGKPKKNYLTISLKQSELNRIFYLKGSKYGKKLAALLTGELKSKKFSVKPEPVQCPEYTDLCENSYGSTPVSIRVEFDEKDKNKLVEGIKKGIFNHFEVLGIELKPKAKPMGITAFPTLMSTKPLANKKIALYPSCVRKGTGDINRRVGAYLEELIEKAGGELVRRRRKECKKYENNIPIEYKTKFSNSDLLVILENREEKYEVLYRKENGKSEKLAESLRKALDEYPLAVKTPKSRSISCEKNWITTLCQEESPTALVRMRVRGILDSEMNTAIEIYVGILKYYGKDVTVTEELSNKYQMALRNFFGIDKCPDDSVEAGKGLEGCADTDKDGIRDEKDKCINHKEDSDGFKDSDGCPDSAREMEDEKFDILYVAVKGLTKKRYRKMQKTFKNSVIEYTPFKVCPDKLSFDKINIDEYTCGHDAIISKKAEEKCVETLLHKYQSARKADLIALLGDSTHIDADFSWNHIIVSYGKNTPDYYKKLVMAHEFSHTFGFCDEYDYSYYKDEERMLGECINEWPINNNVAPYQECDKTPITKEPEDLDFCGQKIGKRDNAYEVSLMAGGSVIRSYIEGGKEEYKMPPSAWIEGLPSEDYEAFRKEINKGLVCGKSGQTVKKSNYFEIFKGTWRDSNFKIAFARKGYSDFEEFESDINEKLQRFFEKRFVQEGLFDIYTYRPSFDNEKPKEIANSVRYQANRELKFDFDAIIILEKKNPSDFCKYEKLNKDLIDSNVALVPSSFQNGNQGSYLSHVFGHILFGLSDEWYDKSCEEGGIYLSKKQNMAPNLWKKKGKCKKYLGKDRYLGKGKSGTLLVIEGKCENIGNDWYRINFAKDSPPSKMSFGERIEKELKDVMRFPKIGKAYTQEENVRVLDQMIKHQPDSIIKFKNKELFFLYHPTLRYIQRLNQNIWEYRKIIDKMGEKYRIQCKPTQNQLDKYKEKWYENLRERYGRTEPYPIREVIGMLKYAHKTEGPSDARENSFYLREENKDPMIWIKTNAKSTLGKIRVVTIILKRGGKRGSTNKLRKFYKLYPKTFSFCPNPEYDSCTGVGDLCDIK